MLIYQHNIRPFSRMLTVLKVVHGVVLSLLNTDDYALQLPKSCNTDPSCISALCHAGICTRGQWALTGCALKHRVGAAHHVSTYGKQQKMECPRVRLNGNGELADESRTVRPLPWKKLKSLAVCGPVIAAEGRSNVLSFLQSNFEY